MNLFYTAGLACSLLLAAATLQAQAIVHIGAGGQLFISAKTAVSVDSLVLVPAQGGFLLGENDISKLAAPVNPFTGTYIKRVYCFSRPIADYNGSVGILYNDNEATALDEGKLLVQAYGSYGWHLLSGNESRNARRNAVGVLGAHHLSFSELLLGYNCTDAGTNESPLALAPLTGAAKAGVNVYPNPASDRVSVRVNSNAVIKSMQVFDASGKCIMVQDGSSGNVCSFNISRLASGIYSMAVETSDGKFEKAFVKH